VQSAVQSDGGTRERFLALHAKLDEAGCASLWTGKPSFALPTIEKDLDEALALRESGRDADAAKALEERALWGARIARDALGAPAIAELAASRIGWNERDRKFFHDSKAVLEKATAFLDKTENRFGLEAAQEAANRSLALGDWHGAARAYEICAVAHQASSNFEDALVAWERARSLDRDLGLQDRELACVRGALDMCGAVERPLRGRETANSGILLARRLGDRKAEADFLDRRARFEEKLGLTAEAQATRRSIDAIGK
jgi:tetratricopeptide (TPR) repeat protein